MYKERAEGVAAELQKKSSNMAKNMEKKVLAHVGLNPFLGLIPGAPGTITV